MSIATFLDIGQVGIVVSETTGIEFTYYAPLMQPFDIIEVVYDEDAEPIEGKNVSYQMTRTPPYEGIFSDKVKVLTSNEYGEVFLLVFPGAEYLVWRGESHPMRIYAPLTMDEDWQLPPVIGNDTVDPCKTV